MAKKRTAKKPKVKAPRNYGWQVVVLHFGYVESSRVAPMILVSSQFMETKLEAVKDVARWFFKKWQEDHAEDEDEVEDCCRTARAAKTIAAKFCPTCGASLTGRAFDEEDYQAWLLDVQGRTADGFGWDDGMDERRWTPWTKFAHLMDTKQIVEVIEQAEEVLSYALDPDTLPAHIAPVIRDYRERMIEHHAENRLYNKKLDMDGIVDHEAKGLVRKH